MAGKRQEQPESNRNMALMILLASLFVYMVMAMLFKSLLHPLVILCTLPFAIVGGYWYALVDGRELEHARL